MKNGVQLLGISNDPVDSHKKFCDSLKLPFPLLADEGGKVSERYGILMVTPQGARLSGRSVFLVDREGIVRHADSKYDLKTPDDHEALLKAVKALGEKSGEGKKDRKPDPPGPEKGEKAAKQEKVGRAPTPLRIEGLAFGRITVNGREYTRDVVLEGGRVRERRKGPSKDEQARYGGHTPLTARESIPWSCRTLVIGTGMEGRLPVAEELKEEARSRGVELVLLPTPKAVERLLSLAREGVNAILHLTC